MLYRTSSHVNDVSQSTTTPRSRLRPSGWTRSRQNTNTATTVPVVPKETGIPTRVLIISDTHNAPLGDEDEPQARPFSHSLPAADVLIHCGDMTMTGQISEYHQTLDMLAQIDAPVKIVIAGNHDRTLDKEWMKTNPHDLPLDLDQRKAIWQEATDLWYRKDGRARKEGVEILDEGLHVIPLANGAILTVYASPYQPEYQNWAFAYPPISDRFNPALTTLIGGRSISTSPKIPSHADRPIDILLTHGPPYANLDRTSTGELAGCPHLLRALMRSRPLLHCFGHIHECWGAQRISWPDASTADEASTRSTTIKKFKCEWADEIAEDGIVRVVADPEATKVRHCVEVDVSARGKRPLVRGRESLLVNAAVMDVAYRPRNAPWLVTLDLPRAAWVGSCVTAEHLARSQTV